MMCRLAPKGFILLLLLLFSWTSQAQKPNQDSSDTFSGQWRFGLVFTDLLIPQATLAVDYRISSLQGIGLHLGTPVPMSAKSNDLYYSSVKNGFLAKLWHRMYIPSSDESSTTQFLLKHGPGFTRGKLGYLTTQWFRDDLNGDEVRVYEERELEDQVSKGHYSLLMGIIIGRNDPVQLEIMLGAQYAFFLQESQAGFGERSESLLLVNQWLFRGVRPFFQATFSFAP